MASSFLLKKKLISPNLLTGLPFRHAAATNCLTSSGETFRHQPISHRNTRSGIPYSNPAISDLLTTSAVTFRQPSASNRHFRPTESFRTSKLLTRSLVPFRPPAASLSLFINGKDFHVDIIDDDSVMERVMKRLCYVIDPRGWWHLVFMSDEENSLQMDLQKELLRYGLRQTDEGVCLHVDIPGVQTRHLKVFVEDSALCCERLRPFRKNHIYQFMLPKKMYQPGDVKAKMKDGVLYVTFANLKKEDVDAMEQN